MTPDENESRDYPVKENMIWQRIEWHIQHIGFALLLVLTVAGAMGFFSKGWISNHSVNSSDGRLQVDYERFGRRESNMDMTLHLTQLQGDTYQIILSGPQMDDFQIQTLQPQPDEAWSLKDALIMRWHRRAAQPSATIWIGSQPQNFGRYQMTATLDGQSRVEFSQFVYP